MNLNCRLNYWDDKYVTGDENVFKADAKKFLFAQPDKPKAKLALFNFWSEPTRSKCSYEATSPKLVIEYDNGKPREEVQEQLSDYDYLIYSTTGNSKSLGLDKFRIILELKEPITLRDLEQNRPNLASFFDGCDISSFCWRGFHRPSRYDKDHDPVTIIEHEGEAFDFYSIFKHVKESDIYKEELNRKLMEMAKPHKTSSRSRPDKMIEWAKMKRHSNLHWIDVPGGVSTGKFWGLDCDEAFAIFWENYAGGSNEKALRANFEKYWRTH